jgi:drug/metabolite transporter (DMT)-like permease
MQESPSQNPAIAIELALLVLLATLWGGSYTFIKLGVATIPPVTLIAARTLIAGLLLLVVMHGRGLRLPKDAAIWRRFLFQACLNSVIPWTLIAWAERSLDAGLATILNSTSPIFAFFLTLAVTRHEAISARRLFGVAAGMAGICLIVGVQALGTSASSLQPKSPRWLRPSAMLAAPFSAAVSRASIRWRRRQARCSVARRSWSRSASWWTSHGRWRHR